MPALPWWRYPLAIAAVSAVVAVYVVGPRYGVLLQLAALVAVMTLSAVPVVFWRRRHGGVMSIEEGIADRRVWVMSVLGCCVPISFVIVVGAVGGRLGVALGALAACCFVAGMIALARRAPPHHRG